MAVNSAPSLLGGRLPPFTQAQPNFSVSVLKTLSFQFLRFETIGSLKVYLIFKSDPINSHPSAAQHSLIYTFKAKGRGVVSLLWTPPPSLPTAFWL